MKKLCYLTLLVLLTLNLSGCQRDYEAPVPYAFANKPGAGQFTPTVRRAIEGVYSVTKGSSQFGEQVAVKWTYVANGPDTIHYLSVFTGTDVGYFNFEVVNTDTPMLTGYWRKLVNTETGRARLSVGTLRNGAIQPYQGRLAQGDTLVLNGLFSQKTAEPDQPLRFAYRRQLTPEPFAILAHRGGGRTSDLLPVSENSLDMIKLASRLGGTGVELDVQYTKDGVPILYHDNALNLRLIQKNGLKGPVKDYTYQQLTTLVRLINGEQIPTLDEALETVISNTSLSFVWLDTKFAGDMQKVQTLQQQYQRRAIQLGRTLQIVIGLPTQDAVDSYNALPNKRNTPILCELDTAKTRSLDADFWAPRWTLGPQTEEVRAMQTQGRTVFVWTLDEPRFINQFINEGRFNGILSNYSPTVAYYQYTRLP